MYMYNKKNLLLFFVCFSKAPGNNLIPATLKEQKIPATERQPTSTIIKKKPSKAEKEIKFSDDSSEVKSGNNDSQPNLITSDDAEKPSLNKTNLNTASSTEENNSTSHNSLTEAINNGISFKDYVNQSTFAEKIEKHIKEGYSLVFAKPYFPNMEAKKINNETDKIKNAEQKTKNKANKLECEQAILKLLDDTEKSIDIQIYSFSLKSIIKKLLEINQKKKHVMINIIIFHTYKDHFIRSLVQCMENLTIKFEDIESEKLCIKFAKGSSTKQFHNKIIIIDNSAVMTGSFNFSDNALNNNEENFVILHQIESDNHKDHLFTKFVDYNDKIQERTFEIENFDLTLDSVINYLKEEIAKIQKEKKEKKGKKIEKIEKLIEQINLNEAKKTKKSIFLHT